ncbi:hypothetical protein A0H81_04652 [Grifola frondosa]|uniref:Uncharacterized protein n=1 Tax=Grifola frondosa TaxID=5627 RepID=A0A1C7MFW4_GRIFR|nr:hypothetical protein A0H81_04652 [Grifola frondosa]
MCGCVPALLASSGAVIQIGYGPCSNDTPTPPLVIRGSTTLEEGPGTGASSVDPSQAPRPNDRRVLMQHDLGRFSRREVWEWAVRWPAVRLANVIEPLRWAPRDNSGRRRCPCAALRSCARRAHHLPGAGWRLAVSLHGVGGIEVVPCWTKRAASMGDWTAIRRGTDAWVLHCVAVRAEWIVDDSWRPVKASERRGEPILPSALDGSDIDCDRCMLSEMATVVVAAARVYFPDLIPFCNQLRRRCGESRIFWLDFHVALESFIFFGRYALFIY